MRLCGTIDLMPSACAGVFTWCTTDGLAYAHIAWSGIEFPFGSSIFVRTHYTIYCMNMSGAHQVFSTCSPSKFWAQMHAARYYLHAATPHMFIYVYICLYFPSACGDVRFFSISNFHVTRNCACARFKRQCNAQCGHLFVHSSFFLGTPIWRMFFVVQRAHTRSHIRTLTANIYAHSALGEHRGLRKRWSTIDSLIIMAHWTH